MKFLPMPMTESNSPRSFGEILRRRKQSNFVGRGDQLESFRHNLDFAAGDDRRKFVFSVYGQGGVGKSTLLKQFSKTAEDAGAVCAYTDESEASVPEVLGRLAEQMEHKGHRLSRFSERYRHFRQKKQELETDPEAPQGFSAFIGKTMVKAGVKLGRRVPVGGAVLDLVDENALADQAGEWTTYISKKLQNKDDVQLIQDPVGVLTPLFLEEIGRIGAKAPIVLFFDTFERTDVFLDEWLRRVLGERYGSLMSNFVFIIAGRRPLDGNHWAEYETIMGRFSLEPFTEEEAKQYLYRQGVTNPGVIEEILGLSGRLPLLVTFLAAESPETPEQISSPGDTAVERFLKWVENPQQRHIALSAAVLRSFNQDMINQLTEAAEAGALFHWLRNMPFVKKQRDDWVYHEVVRELMLRHQRQVSPQSWADTQTRLIQYFDSLQRTVEVSEAERERHPDWQRYELLKLYHQLCLGPQQRLPDALNGFLAALKNQRSFASQWAEALQQAGKDIENRELQQWGEELSQGLADSREGRYEEAAAMFTKLLGYAALEPQ